MGLKKRMILSFLRRDARISLASLAEDVQMPVSTIYDKVNSLQMQGIITRFTALLDFSKLGYHHHAVLAVKVNPSQKEECLNFLHSMPCINSLHEINSGYDFLLETVHQNIKEYIIFKEALTGKFGFLSLQEFQITSIISREVFKVIT